MIARRDVGGRGERLSRGARAVCRVANPIRELRACAAPTRLATPPHATTYTRQVVFEVPLPDVSGAQVQRDEVMLEFHVDDTAADDKEDTLVEMAFHVSAMLGVGCMGVVCALQGVGGKGGARARRAARRARWWRWRST